MYHCMLILTDGDIHDIKETTDLIVELGKYPISLIIIGVGKEEFTQMKFLDTDETILRNSKGQVAVRDIVQFVKFMDYNKGDITRLAEEVLKKMPDQVVTYMMQKGIQPKKQDWMPVDDILNGQQLL